MARRPFNVFGLSFLDAMTCGLGAVILLFMVINAAVGERAGRVTRDLRAEVDRLEREVLEGYQNLVEVRNSVEVRERELVTARGLSIRLLETVSSVEQELATYSGETLARRRHINRLQADLRSLEEETKRLSALAPSDETPGDRVRAFLGDGDRQYLTGLKVGGQRILILVDSSASMLGETLVNVIRRRNLPDEQKLRAGKWRQAVATVEWLLTQLPRESRFQVLTFADEVRPVVEGSSGGWLDASDGEALDRAAASLRQTVPGGGTNLHRAFAAIATLRPKPDNLILLVDGLPTQGRQPARGGTVSGKQRARLYNRAIEQLPSLLPVNVVLFPMEGDPEAASAYWKLAVGTGGSFLTPSEDWP